MMSDPIFKEMAEKHQAAKDKAKEGKVKAAEGENPLLLERNPYGLYTVRYESGGAVPDILKGTFTSVQQVTERVLARYGKNILKVA